MGEGPASSSLFLPFFFPFPFFARDHEERSDEVRFSIARFSRDESLFMRQFQQNP